jgi:hypothetical protein
VSVGMSLVFSARFDLCESPHSMRLPDDPKYPQISSKVEAKDCAGLSSTKGLLSIPHGTSRSMLRG